MKKSQKRKDGSRRYYLRNRKRIQARQLAYDKEHRQEKRDREKRRREVHPRRHARLKREAYLRNRKRALLTAKRYNLKHRLKKAKAAREWRRRHPRKAKALATKTRHLRRARISKASGSFTHKEFRNLCKRSGYICLCCKRTEKQLLRINRKLVPDHVIPISRGGNNSIDNIQPLCHAMLGGRGGCNNRKHASSIDYRIVNGPFSASRCST